MSASLRSRRVGSPRVLRTCFGHHDPYRPAIRVDDLAVADLVLHPAEGMHAAGVAAYAPLCGSSVSSTSAIRLLVVGSQPGNSMPAALRIRLRPPSHPTRYSARSDWPSETCDVDAGVVLREPGHFASAIDRHRQLSRPSRPGCARCGSARARASRDVGWESR